MEGDINVRERTTHFTSETELRDTIKSGLRATLDDYYRETFLIIRKGKSKVFDSFVEIDIDETVFQIQFPPFAFQFNDKELVENLEIYWNRNRDYFLGEIEAIIASVKRGDFKCFSSIKLTENIFESVKPYSISEGLETVFSNKQAIQLCRKIFSPFTRIILKNPANNIIAIHQIAMKAYTKYGGYVLSFLLSLPELTFGNQNSKLLTKRFSYQGEVPSLKIRIQNGTEYFMSFHEPRKRFGKASTVATVYNKAKRIVEGHLTIQGYLEARIQSEKVSLHLFVDNLKKPTTIFSGVELGRCIYCNQELTDNKSLRNGYGRDCAENLGLDYN